MFHFFVTPDCIDGDTVCLSGMDVNHIKNVLRMKINDEISISDGEGRDYLCFIESMGTEIICKIKSTEISASEPCVRTYVFQGLPKADKFETVIQKTIELGAYEIIPVQTERSIIRYDSKKQLAKLERWSKIAQSAAKQSHRGIVPKIRPVMSFKEALNYAEKLDMVLIPYENFKDIKATKSIIKKIKPEMNVGIFIGPEGGFECSEIEAAVNSGALQISLGNRILRTETAAMMLLSVINFETESD